VNETHYGGSVRQAESSVRGDDDVEMDEVEEERPATSGGSASLAKLLGVGASDAKEVVTGEAFFFEDP
jgi:hypothetical protein